jgi:hypothetical protein
MCHPERSRGISNYRIVITGLRSLSYALTNQCFGEQASLGLTGEVPTIRDEDCSK